MYCDKCHNGRMPYVAVGKEGVSCAAVSILLGHLTDYLALENEALLVCWYYPV